MLQMAVLKKSVEETTEGANVGGAEMLRLERIARTPLAYFGGGWRGFCRGHVVFRDEPDFPWVVERIQDEAMDNTTPKARGPTLEDGGKIGP